MTEKFVASNGVIVDQVPTTIGNRFVVQDVNPAQREGSRILSRSNWLDPRDADALREFFQQERDLELGRWRWPENPDVVVQVDKGGERAWVVNECSPHITGCVWRVDVDCSTAHAQVVAAARAYFAAHPEPKPWHDAQEGDVWAVTPVGHSEPMALTVIELDGRPAFTDPVDEMFISVDGDIKSARRIWPEAPNV